MLILKQNTKKNLKNTLLYILGLSIVLALVCSVATLSGNAQQPIESDSKNGTVILEFREPRSETEGSNKPDKGTSLGGGTGNPDGKSNVLKHSLTFAGNPEGISMVSVPKVELGLLPKTGGNNQLVLNMLIIGAMFILVGLVIKADITKAEIKDNL